MSRFNTLEPVCNRRDGAVALVIRSRKHDLGGLPVRRVLPAPERRMIGPFIFVDEMGPMEYSTGNGISVRPHPHIGLSTVTYLFEGEIRHRDSLGTERVIRPGAVNLMTAGRGIVHSEREAPAQGDHKRRMHGMQIWMALPRKRQEIAPSFTHYPADALPVTSEAGCRTTTVIGRYGDAISPVKVPVETLYLVQHLDEGSTVAVPDSVAERAVYVVEGRIEVGGCLLRTGEMAVLNRGMVHLVSNAATRLLVLGGPAFSRRRIWWNFVHTDDDRIERAKADWRAGRFPSVPGDDEEFIPLPD
jgi:redox-sensitive bicupin YhaK (pirin superfamily)